MIVRADNGESSVVWQESSESPGPEEGALFVELQGLFNTMYVHQGTERCIVLNHTKANMLQLSKLFRELAQSAPV